LEWAPISTTIRCASTAKKRSKKGDYRAVKINHEQNPVNDGDPIAAELARGGEQLMRSKIGRASEVSL
jgi:hypothetical protein